MKRSKKNPALPCIFWSYGKIGAVISGVTSAVGTALVSVLGGWDKPLQLLMVALVLDFVLGTLAAAKNHELDSKVAFWGGINKLIVLCFVAVGVILDGVLPLSQPYCRTAVIFFYVGREGLSMIENYGKMGGAMPGFLRDILAQMQDYGDRGEQEQVEQQLPHTIKK